jgi:hypothetical protein
VQSASPLQTHEHEVAVWRNSHPGGQPNQVVATGLGQIEEIPIALWSVSNADCGSARMRKGAQASVLRLSAQVD